jgi:hypothetical protein
MREIQPVSQIALSSPVEKSDVIEKQTKGTQKVELS